MSSRTGLMVIACLTLVVSAGSRDSPEILLIRAFGQSITSSWQTAELDDSIAGVVRGKTGFAPENSSFLLYTATRHDSTLGYAVVDSVRSKSSTLVFALILDISGRLESLSLLSTPDPRSARLNSRGWLRQFESKRRIGKADIAAVSDATISARDITNSVIFFQQYFILRNSDQVLTR